MTETPGFDERLADLPAREMKIRSGRAYGIRYYLDGNKSVGDLACYRIRVDGPKVATRRIKLS